MIANLIKFFGLSTLSAYSMVLFSSSPYIGFLILLATIFNPPAALTGFLGIVFSNLIALFIGVDRDRIKKGLYGFNGLLVGLSISLYHNVDGNLILMLFAASVLLVFFTLGIEYVFGYYLGLPVLSIPFVFVSLIVYLAFYDYRGFVHRAPYYFPYDANFPEVNRFILFYLKSFGGIFFQSSPWAGLSFALIMLLISRIAFLLSILGFSAGVAFHIILTGDINDLYAGSVGFNYILSAIAIGGFFLIPSPKTFILAGLAAIVSALIASFTKVFLIQFNLPVLALPFTTVSLLLLYVAKLLRNNSFVVVDFIPGIPENNLDFYKTRLQRFGIGGLYIRLPFSGKWKVSQGYDGEYTHKDEWRESLDFMAIGPEGKLRKGTDSSPSDYYTYGLPVFSVSAGRVVKVVKHLDDNKVGEVDTKNNWGNLILIEHAPYLYSQISHLQKNSILVKEGDYVIAGAKLGLAGNSGRSLEPHLHLHFQSTPELGSSTIPVSFTQYSDETGSGVNVKFNSVPKEGVILSNLTSDMNLKNFFTLPPGQEYSITITKPGGKTITEKWKVHIDLLGTQFIEDEKQNRLYFFNSLDYFACLDYSGKKNAGLFFFYLSFYRVPLLSAASSWEDTISYKYFSSLPLKLAKDLIHPFSNKVGFEWKGNTEIRDSKLYLKSRVMRNANSSVYECEVVLENSAPGSIKIINKEGEEWILNSNDST